MNALRVAIEHESGLVVAGIAALLEQYPDRVLVVDGTSGVVDVILYGLAAEAETPTWEPIHDDTLHNLIRRSQAAVIALGWPGSPGVHLAMACGARGWLSLDSTADELVEALSRIHAEEPVELPQDGRCHPGVARSGLTPREVDVLALIGTGATNAEIAAELFVSVNSVKTYIRTAYRKIGVSRRTQAVLWAEHHGLHPTVRPEAIATEAVG
ncbi:response regulator transcription factor [Nocardioides euryhalodurans]|uniref:Response regulator transcription factor n=1 Tax=Nocardioides euryhalodurans TaxID=2518370 RepID=A0A4P7GND5_9ACTN|nr:response regulator transcription factor [Nocardioides euryhalodurans]QBR93291.1 response regulator transcription factor [Nocardioides euryhalodurans]